MTPIVLCAALIRWGEAIRKRYAGITGRRAQRFFIQAKQRVVVTGPSFNRQARHADRRSTSDHKETMAAMRSTERAFKRTQ